MDDFIYINDLSKKLSQHRKSIDLAISRVIDSGFVMLGPEVKRFENSFASYIGVKHCIGVGNGTDALELGLRAIGINSNSKVATVANAGMYTVTALNAIGAKPYFIDVDINTHNTYLSEVERAISNGIDAIVITHLYGLPVKDISSIITLCKKNNILVFEDCAQAHGASIEGEKVGSFGDAASFSFYPTKNLGAIGDGGAVVTNSDCTSELLFSLRQYGWKDKYYVEEVGGKNSRLDEVQASILSELLPSLDAENAKRKSIASKYNEMIDHPMISLPVNSFENSVFHLYVLRVKKRDSLRSHLESKKIISDIHYPIPDHKQPIFREKWTNLSLHASDLLASENLTLPCHPFMSDEMIQRVILAVNSWTA